MAHFLCHHNTSKLGNMFTELRSLMIKLVVDEFYLVEGRVCHYAGTAQSKYFGTIYNFIDEFDYCWRIVQPAMPYIKPWIK